MPISSDELKKSWLAAAEAVTEIKREIQEAQHSSDTGGIGDNLLRGVLNELDQAVDTTAKALGVHALVDVSTLVVSTEEQRRLSITYLENLYASAGQAEGKVIGNFQGIVRTLMDAYGKLSKLLGLLRR